jgi:transposase
LYLEGGIEGLKGFGYHGRHSDLAEHAPRLEVYFKAHPPRTVAEVQAAIEQLTDLHRSPTQVRAFLKRLGMRYLKVGYVPGKATTPEKAAEQAAFTTQELEPYLAEAQAGERVVLFMDAAHFVHHAVLAAVWCFTRLFIPSPSGRKRFNVLGALNAVTQEVLTFTNETYINAVCVCALLDQIAQRYVGLPITIVLNNARYQRCQLVQSHAAALGIELLFLPSYSPHLNLIERFWRFVRKECLYAKYYEDFAAFRQAIDDCVHTAHIEHREELA